MPFPTPEVPAGLTGAEAAARLLADGPNELAHDREKTWVDFLWGALKEPMLALLVVAAIAYGLLGEVAEAGVLAGWVGALIALTVYQERRTERAVAALRDLTSPRAQVVRDGVSVRIAGRDVVAGDCVLLSEGDRVPADGVLLDARNLRLDESLLTGEAVPVSKRCFAEPDAEVGAPGGDDTPYVFAGTLVVAGRGAVRVTRTGQRAEVGKIGAALSTMERGRTLLQREIDLLVRRLAIFGVIVSMLIAIGFAWAHGDPLGGLLAGISSAMALLPEELPVVLTVFLALGAWRLSQHGVLTRQVAAIEALGAATVLCTDKTGTLTENRMRVARLVAGGADVAVDGGPLPEVVHAALEIGILASQSDPFDPMEKAFLTLGRQALEGTEHLHPGWVIEREYPLSPELLAMCHCYRSADGTGWLIAAKGAPEAVADLCHLDPDAAAKVQQDVRTLARDGLRVLGVAVATFQADGELPPRSHDFAFTWVGLVGLEDPVRADVPAAVAAARGAGIRVVMITGDYPETAVTIARRAGIEVDGVVTGAELEAMDDAALAETVRRVSVFARAVPAHKLRLVRAFQADGEVVAMTGDGVNDAPALKAADIGIAMGGRGTDVAREAAALVLTDDAFPALVTAVRIGRRVQDNLRKAMAFVLAVHVPMLGLSTVPVLLGWPLLLSPVHVVFLELLIDPACSIAFEAEPEEPGILERPPRRKGSAMFDRRMVLASLLQGLSVLAVSLGAHTWALRAGGAEDAARAAAFASLIAGNVSLIVVNRSWSRPFWASGAPGTAAIAVIAAAVGGVVLIFEVPFLRDLFQFAWPEPAVLGGSTLAALCCLLWFEVVKWARPDWLAEDRRDGAAR